ncbi:MAG: alpha-L-rhamnosidase [Akkermansiaceae bacterium]|nr:alpha-L-rhamnosidase [Armatimonadota bacterium]
MIVGSPYAGQETQSWGKRGRWTCAWVSCADVVPPPFVSAYRCRFATSGATTIRVHVTADERYELFLDGQRIGRGSERGDAQNWFFETYELTLEPGAHTLVARVWSQGSMAAFAQMTVRPGFLLAPQDNEHDALIGTGIAPWEAKVLPGYTFTDPIAAWGTGANLVVDGSAFAWDFEHGAGDGWAPVVTAEKGADFYWRNEVTDEALLRPAVLPAMMEQPYHGGRVRHVEAVAARETHDIAVQAANHLAQESEGWQRLVAGDAALTIPANTRRRVILDLQNYLCAYPEVTVSGGAGGMVRVHWQESLYTDPRKTIKENRDQIEGKYFVTVWHLKDGIGDSFLPDGGDNRRFDTLWWQCGRYVEILVETKDTPLTIHRLVLRETRYPLEMRSTFDASDARLSELIPLTLRTLQMCSHETYMDCPYFEQLMYIGDTRLQALITYTITADDRLPRKAVELLGASRMLSGLTQSRYPGRVRQIIPPFSLWWVCMVYDYALWRGDSTFVRELMPTVRGILDHFLRLRDADGLIAGPKGWNVQDWVPSWKDGVPPDGYDGANGLLNWQFIYTLELAAKLETWLGEPEQAARNRRLIGEILPCIEKTFWNAERGLYADDKVQQFFSEHTQCIALLSGILGTERSEPIFANLLSTPDLAHTTIYFSHYLFDTLYQHGRTDIYLERLSYWHELNANGLKTTIEMPEPTRSDCHAWGAHPLYHFFASLLGVRPGEMGFASVRIAPQLGTLTAASGRVAHPAGFIEVALDKSAERLTAQVALPPGITGVFMHGGREVALHPGSQTVSLPVG